MTETGNNVADSRGRSESPSGFNEEYEPLSDHEATVTNINPFATNTTTTAHYSGAGKRDRLPNVETVSSPPSSRGSSSSSSSSVSPEPLVLRATDRHLDRSSNNYSPFDPIQSAGGASTCTSSNNNTGAAVASFFSPQQLLLHSLLDESSDHGNQFDKGFDNNEDSSDKMGVRMTQNATTSGMAGFLEMEVEPLRSNEPQQPIIHSRNNYDNNNNRNYDNNQNQHYAQQILEDQDDLIDFTPADEPIQTSSGLLLTHRRSSAENKKRYAPQATNQQSQYPASYRPSPNRFEVEQMNPWGGGASSSMLRGNSGGGGGGTPLHQARQLLSLFKVWVLFFCVVLVLGTGVLFHGFRNEDAGATVTTKQQQQNQITSTEDHQQQQGDMPQQILLLPLNNAAELARQQREFEEAQRDLKQRGNRRLLSSPHGDGDQQQHHSSRHLLNLRLDFENWIQAHTKQYQSEQEKEHRFGIWSNNHFRTLAKNKKHGNCRLTNKPVFGSNHLQDLTTEEFQSQFLTGYNGPNADGHEVMTGRKRNLQAAHSPPAMHSGLGVKRHPSVHKRMLSESRMNGYTVSTSSCTWYDVSCWMRVIMNEYLYVGTGTMEPVYDSESYPTALDWRDFGAVTEVRRQGDCGACWAITAVETIESAYFIGTGSLLDLSESEVIACTDSCNMCYGGWPQDGYDYVMGMGGIPLANDWAYDGDTLLAVTQELETGDGELDSDLFASFIGENCPASQGSGDNNNNDDSTGARYGNIKGYGFATERCVCYSDGSGCDCDNQNENMAVRNLASYGPATVCLDASVWQDYEGGIITADSGCSAKFLAMNHCVQVVGYAYSSGGDGDGEDGENSDSGSNDSGSADGGDREGYWIVRNQWSTNWGMSGYAYVAMGENTCGILNDITQAYL